MLAMSRDLGVSYKCAYVLLHKLREAMAEEMKGRTLGGEGKVAEIDGGYFGGYVKPANNKENRRDRRLARNQNGKCKAVVIIRERNGRSLPAVFRTEGQARDALHAPYEMRRINHEEAYSLDGACTNWVEEFFSWMRRAEQGHHHHIAGPYLLRYAQEASWREDHRRINNGEQVHMVSGLAMRRGPSVDFCGYWQRHITAA
jgi:ISXO2-like transposase domain